ncbi:MAG: sulfur carrier protein ThiS adenylyltransferase ThiF [Spirochaetales bacterium]|nr:sulfur carrier protein ThiS adenylyltransferase ThiF [Spirochaetales bacterium]
MRENLFVQALEDFFSKEQIAVIQKKKVGICGAGGLGSNAAVNLVRSGFCHFVIADFDNVSPGNLNRQFFFYNQIGEKKVEALRENLFTINPDLDISVFDGKITKDNINDVFDSCDVVIEACDSVDSKQLIAETFLNKDKILVSVSGIAGTGNADDIIIQRLRENFFLIGDGKSEAGILPPLSPRVQVAAAKQADIVLEQTLYPKRAVNNFDWGLYGITAEKFSGGRNNLSVVQEMIDAGIRVIQYREKEKSQQEKYRECIQIRNLCKKAGVCFIVNDDPAIARLVDADGVHVGQDDLPVAEVRKIIGYNKIVGLSTHSPEQARQALSQRPDYIGAGPLFQTSTKDDVCDPVGLEYLEYVVRNIPLPFVAIGGIKKHNIHEVVQRGAKNISLVTEITGAVNIKMMIKELKMIIDSVKK